jgi:phosphate transport system permease protein
MTTTPTSDDAMMIEARTAAGAGAPAAPEFRLSGTGGRKLGERVIEAGLFVAAVSSVVITLAIVGVLLYESSTFFSHVSIVEYLTSTRWTPLFEDAHYGVLPLLSGTLVTTAVALLVAIPLGTVSAVYLSEYAPHRVREVVKPMLELLAAVPTVVYGYFALLFVTPLLQQLLANVGVELPGFNMLSAGLVMGVMIIPYVASLSEDAMRAVPMHLREGSYAMGATRMQTAFRVVVPASLSGITAAYILGISRAVGETMVVAVAAGMQPNLTADPTEPAATITAYIVQVSLGDLPHGSIGYQSIFAVGLTLMLMTLAFNIGGYLLRKRYREAY